MNVPFHHIFINIYHFCGLFDDSHSDRYEGICHHLASICVSLMSGDVDHLSMCLLAICIISLKKIPIQVFSSFFNQVIIIFFWCWVVWTVSFFWVPYQLHCLQIFSLTQQVVFSFCQWIPLLCKKIFDIN